MDRHILDLGCRDGALTLNLLEGNSIVGANIDGRALRRGRTERRLTDAVQLDLTDPLPFAGGAFDTVFGEVMEHQPSSESLVAAAGVLVPEGWIIGSVPNACRLKNRLRFLFGRPFDTDPTHVRFFPRKSLREWLAARSTDIEIRPGVGRFAAIHPELFSNSLVWRCRKKNR